jgi:pentatricopeptide repeat protein
LNANLYAILYSACSAASNEKAIELGKQLLSDMPQIFKDELIVMGSAIHMLMKFGYVEEAERLFAHMKKRDPSSYGVMMNGYNLNGLSENALDLFDEVSSMLNANLYTIMYSTCATLSNERAIKLGKQLLEEMSTKLHDDLAVMGSAIHMLMKFDEVEEAERLFAHVKKRAPSIYGVMMNGYNLNGEPQKCLKLFEEVKQQKVKPDEPISLSLISACSKIGMLSICRDIVKQISTEVLNCPRVQNSLIDMWVSVLRAVDAGFISYKLLLIRAKQVPLTKPSKCFNQSANLPQ